MRVSSVLLPNLLPKFSFPAQEVRLKQHNPLKRNGEPGGNRTHYPMIKSHVLYRLSYGLISPTRREARERHKADASPCVKPGTV